MLLRPGVGFNHRVPRILKEQDTLIQIKLPERPGFGIEFDHAKIEDLAAVDNLSQASFRRSDGRVEV